MPNTSANHLLRDAPMVNGTIEPQQRLYVESDLNSPDLLKLHRGQTLTQCRRCPGKTEPNDDSAAIVQTSSGAIVLIIADGVGGCPNGHQASAIAVQTIISKVLDAASNSDLRPAILDAIDEANQSILDLSIGAATTLAIVEIQNRVARGYQVGDSTSLFLGQRGTIKWKSTSHSPVGYAIEAGLLTESDAMFHEQRHVVSNLVGSRNMHIEIGPAQPLATRDTIIVGSDGLFDNVKIEEVIEHGRCGKLTKRMKCLDKLATERMSQNQPGEIGKPDDLAIIIYTPT